MDDQSARFFLTNHMIEGLNITIKGTELKQLCLKQAEHHRERATIYGEQLASMEKAAIEGMNYSSGDPKRTVKEKQEEHLADAGEMDFIAAHVNEKEEFLLSTGDLKKIGVVRRGNYF